MTRFYRFLWSDLLIYAAVVGIALALTVGK